MKPQIENSLGDLKDKVVNASDLKGNAKSNFDCSKLSFIPSLKEGVDNYFREAWIKAIEDYCAICGILPQDLINTHKEVNKSTLKRKTGKATHSVESKHLNWRQNYKNRKTGQ